MTSGTSAPGPSAFAREDERDGDAATAAGRLRALTIAGGRELHRDRLFLALLVGLPTYFVGVWGLILPADALAVTVPSSGGTAVVDTDLVALTTVLVAPTTAALLVGIAALFVASRSAGVDERLAAVGYRRAELLTARAFLLGGLAIVVAAVTLAVTAIHVAPAAPGWFVVALVLAGVTYGAVGALAGAFLNRMGGVYLLLFAPMLDIMLLGMPLADAPAWASWLPGHHATELALSAAFADRVALTHAGWGVVVALALWTAALATAGRR